MRTQKSTTHDWKVPFRKADKVPYRTVIFKSHSPVLDTWTSGCFPEQNANQYESIKFFYFLMGKSVVCTVRIWMQSKRQVQIRLYNDRRLAEEIDERRTHIYGIRIVTHVSSSPTQVVNLTAPQFLLVFRRAKRINLMITQYKRPFSGKLNIYLELFRFSFTGIKFLLRI